MKANKYILAPPKTAIWKIFIKNILYPFINILYHILIRIPMRRESSGKYRVSVCCIFKNEGEYLPEWIYYHLFIGVDHFYMYNNLSKDNYLSALKPFIEKGIVTLIDWPVDKGQIPAYKNWYENYRFETKWICFLDIDEFINPYFENNIYSWISKYGKYPCVAVYWKMFGTSGLEKPQRQKLVIEQYVVCWDKYHYLGKVFYNTSFKISTFDSMMHHLTKCKIRFMGIDITIPPINEFKKFIIWNIHKLPLHEKRGFTIQINHYWSKAYELFLIKQRRTDVLFDNNPNTNEFFFRYETNCRSVDYRIFRFMIFLKNKLKDNGINYLK